MKFKNLAPSIPASLRNRLSLSASPATAPIGTMTTLSSFLDDNKKQFLQDLQSQNVDRWTVVMGNEAGDLDSIASSVAYSYLSTKLHKQPTIALVQTPRTNLYLRPENLYAFALARLDANQKELLCIDDVPAATPLSQNISKYALVDHNQLLEQFQGKGKVVAIIDHHEDEKAHLDAEIREIKTPVGSCASLVTKHFRDNWDDTVPRELATLLLCSIHIDTAGLKADDKTQKVDVKSAKFLVPVSTYNEVPFSSLSGTPLPPLKLLAEQLSEKKKDVSALSTRDLLRRDYKEFIFGGLRTGLPTVPSGLEESLQKDEQYWKSLQAYMEERKLAILGVLMTFRAQTKPKHRREILMLLKEGAVPAETESRLFEGLAKDPELKLEPKQEVDIPAGLHARVWNQTNTEPSRKYTAPLVKRLVEGNGATSS